MHPYLRDYPDEKAHAQVKAVGTRTKEPERPPDHFYVAEDIQKRGAGHQGTVPLMPCGLLCTSTRREKPGCVDTEICRVVWTSYSV